MNAGRIQRRADLRERMGLIRTKSQRLDYIRREVAREAAAERKAARDARIRAWWEAEARDRA